MRPIEFLLSSGAKLSNCADQDDDNLVEPASVVERPSVIVLGALVQLKNAQWYLEDLTNLVKLDFSQTRFHQVKLYVYLSKCNFGLNLSILSGKLF